MPVLSPAHAHVHANLGNLGATSRLDVPADLLSNQTRHMQMLPQAGFRDFEEGNSRASMTHALYKCFMNSHNDCNTAN